MADAIEWVKLVLETAGAGGAGLAFLTARKEWHRSQSWRKSEELEKVIDRFEADPCCALARTLLDWSARKTTHAGAELIVTTAGALEAVALHDVDGIVEYTVAATALRDALDAILSFFGRLEGALDREFIETGHAEPYFRYWIERLVTYDRHSDDEGTEGLRVARYIARYSDAKVIASLARRFGVPAPHLDRLVKKPNSLERLAISKKASRPRPD